MFILPSSSIICLVRLDACLSPLSPSLCPLRTPSLDLLLGVEFYEFYRVIPEK